MVLVYTQVAHLDIILCIYDQQFTKQRHRINICDLTSRLIVGIYTVGSAIGLTMDQVCIL